LGVEIDEFRLAHLWAGRYDIIHVHWAEQYALSKRNLRAALFNAASFLTAVDVGRRRGTHVVWTVHNILPHEEFHPRLQRWVMNAFARRVDATIHLSEAARSAALAAYPILHRTPAVVIPHGHYRDVYPDEASAAEARSRLGLSPSVPVLLYFGQIRRYKNVPELLQAFSGLANRDAVLLIAGDPVTSELRSVIESLAANDVRVRLSLRWIEDDQVQYYLRAASLVVLPYREVLNSGAAHLALSFDRPVLVPDQGSLPDLQQQVGPKWVHLYHGPLTVDHLQAALDSAVSPRVASARPPLIGWTEAAVATLHLYQDVLGRPGLSRKQGC
jgi:glycosyltransferase involved in cell wall biosynthesis